MIFFSFQSYIKYKKYYFNIFLTKTIILIKNLMFFKINKRYVNKNKIQNNCIFKFNNNIKQFYFFLFFFYI